MIDAYELRTAIIALPQKTVATLCRGLEDLGEHELALELAREVSRPHWVCSDGGEHAEYDVDARQVAAARYVNDGEHSDPVSTVWHTVTVWPRYYVYAYVVDDVDDSSTHRVAVDPKEPPCSNLLHNWQAEYAVVGGVKENPGVWGHGGGVRINEVCASCGLLRVTDTWAQNPDTGEQGLQSVEYHKEGHQYWDAWKRWRACR